MTGGDARPTSGAAPRASPPGPGVVKRYSEGVDSPVIGGGINGLFSALELARAGLSVTLLERGATGPEASWAAGGIFSPLYPRRHPAPVTVLARWSQIR